MISYLKGKIQSINNGKATLITTSGIGFSLQIINGENIKQDDNAELFVYYNWNQEQGPTLFGFTKLQEKSIFELIIECQGIGPKMAASILNQIKPEVLIHAIAQNDKKTLSSINGIGPKKAEQIIFQLKDKIDRLKETITFETCPIAKHFGTISQVLVSLNYSKPEISRALDHLGDSFKQEDVPFDELLRKSLSFLSKRA